MRPIIFLSLSIVTFYLFIIRPKYRVGDYGQYIKFSCCGHYESLDVIVIGGSARDYIEGLINRIYCPSCGAIYPEREIVVGRIKNNSVWYDPTTWFSHELEVKNCKEGKLPLTQ